MYLSEGFLPLVLLKESDKEGKIGEAIVDADYSVHKALGLGLLEYVYILDTQYSNPAKKQQKTSRSF